MNARIDAAAAAGNGPSQARPGLVQSNTTNVAQARRQNANTKNGQASISATANVAQTRRQNANTKDGQAGINATANVAQARRPNANAKNGQVSINATANAAQARRPNANTGNGRAVSNATDGPNTSQAQKDSSADADTRSDEDEYYEAIIDDPDVDDEAFEEDVRAAERFQTLPPPSELRSEAAAARARSAAAAAGDVEQLYVLCSAKNCWEGGHKLQDGMSLWMFRLHEFCRLAWSHNVFAMSMTAPFPRVLLAHRQAGGVDWYLSCCKVVRFRKDFQLIKGPLPRGRPPWLNAHHFKNLLESYMQDLRTRLTRDAVPAYHEAYGRGRLVLNLWQRLHGRVEHWSKIRLEEARREQALQDAQRKRDDKQFYKAVYDHVFKRSSTVS